MHKVLKEVRCLPCKKKKQTLDALAVGERKRKDTYSPIFTLCCGCFRMSSTIWRAASSWEGRCRAGLQLVLSRYKVWICFPTLRTGSFSMDGVYLKSPERTHGGQRQRQSTEHEALQQQMGICFTGLRKTSVESGTELRRIVQLPCGHASILLLCFHYSLQGLDPHRVGNSVKRGPL